MRGHSGAPLDPGRVPEASGNESNAVARTPAFWAIVDANRAPEDAELADVIDELKSPDAVTIEQISGRAMGTFQAWMLDRKNRRQRLRKTACGRSAQAASDPRPKGTQHPRPSGGAKRPLIWRIPSFRRVS
jgi:hypothetical protein